MISITIPGKPIAKNRPRFARRGKFTTTYSDQETEEGLVILELQKVKERLTGPLALEIWFHIKRPKGHFGTGKNAGVLKPSAPKYPNKKPDIDNMLKFYMDCMNTVIFHDDSAIITVNAHKRYSKDPRTEINIIEMGR